MPKPNKPPSLARWASLRSAQPTVYFVRLFPGHDTSTCSHYGGTAAWLSSWPEFGRVFTVIRKFNGRPYLCSFFLAASTSFCLRPFSIGASKIFEMDVNT